MIRLRELAHHEVSSWDEARRVFAFPQIGHYNIAADCLGHDPNQPALLVVEQDGITSFSFGQLDTQSARLAAGLLTLGVVRGDRIAVKLSQSVEMAVTFMAVLRIGAIVVPISNVLGEDGVQHRLADCGARLLIARGSETEVDLARCAGIPLVTAGDEGPSPSIKDLISDATGSGTNDVATSPDDPAILLYTSGTTGKPKGVLHGHRVILGHHPIDYAFNFVQPNDVSYSPVDWAWAGGVFLGLLVPLAHGVPVVTYREPRFDPERALQVLGACGVTIGLFPPTVMRLIRQSGVVTPTVRDSLKLRCFITGAEAVEPELFGWAAETLGVTVNNAYGLTESNCLIGHAAALGSLEPTCLGLPYPGRCIELFGEDGLPVAPGEQGEIAVAADDPVVMLGYWNAPEATEAKLAGGWLRTGDTAHADDDGLLYFHGRSDDIIKSGAYRIGPAEIEAIILQNGAVAECAVVGMPDPMRGQVVTAAVRLRDPTFSTDGLLEAFQAEVRNRVGAHAYPRVIHFVDKLPRTVTGKVDRVTLRVDLAAAADGKTA
jgi:acetyl-CoA synthetase